MRYRKNKSRRVCDECYVVTCKRRTSSVDQPVFANHSPALSIDRRPSAPVPVNPTPDNRHPIAKPGIWKNKIYWLIANPELVEKQKKLAIGTEGIMASKINSWQKDIITIICSQWWPLVISTWFQVFVSPLSKNAKKFKQILVYTVGFQCPHNLMVSVPLNLHS